MRRHVRARALASGVLAAVIGLGAAPAPRPDWEPLLSLPLSPGSVGLLVEHAGDLRVGPRLEQALKDERPEVRAAAARAINVAGLRGLVLALSAALAVETDASAGTEEAEALAALGAPMRDAELLAAAARDPRFARPVAMALARIRGTSALSHAGLVLGDHRTLVDFVALATRSDAAALSTAGTTATRDGKAALASAVFAAAADAGLALEEAAIAAAASPVAEIRAAGYWHVTLAPEAPSPGLVSGLDAGPEAKGTSEDAPARLAFEMVRRRLRRPRQEDPLWLTVLGDPGPRGVPHEVAEDEDALKRLTRAELAALSVHLRNDPESLGKALREGRRGGRGRPTPTARPLLRTLDGYPRGLVGDVMRVSGCAPGLEGTFFHGGEVTYGTDGRPRRVSLLPPGQVKPECVTAMRALLMLRIADGSAVRANGHVETLIQPLLPTVISCLQQEEPVESRRPEPAGESVSGRRARVQEPKKLVHVAPVYSDAAKSARVDGMVVLEAVISGTGCVRAVTVVRPVDPRLDLSALWAVSQWRYTPTLLDGVAVPVLMTVTVNFRLR